MGCKEVGCYLLVPLRDSNTTLCDRYYSYLIAEEIESQRGWVMCPVRKRLSIDLNSEQSEPDPLLLTMHCHAKHREDNISAVHPQERKEKRVPAFLFGFSWRCKTFRPLNIWTRVRSSSFLPRSCHQSSSYLLFLRNWQWTMSPLQWGTCLLKNMNFLQTSTRPPISIKDSISQCSKLQVQKIMQTSLSKQENWFDGYGAIMWNLKAARPLHGLEARKYEATRIKRDSLCLISALFCSFFSPERLDFSSLSTL